VTLDSGVSEHAAGTGAKCDLMDTDDKRSGLECMLDLQEAEDRKTPAATAAEFLLRAGES